VACTAIANKNGSKRSIPDKPRSSKQRYLVTPDGENALSAHAQVAKDEER